MADATTGADDRNQRRTLVGIVTRDKTTKTRRVDVERLVKHARYGKYVKKRTICYVHDEKNETHVGDTVEIMETRPMSKLKCWRLLRIIAKAPVKVQVAETPTA
ncbi:MAG TPA: 30S ribosomal protein S17 [Gemmataceae bacterium]|jgi:small subunit ribosomal protein S17|nr:30S ribosomal protein S17 [Gemmataceae bacterium]